ncbi:GD25101 [Drosophila simulans]|uniref:GD25101 n=1 Tax=Drosophila simulans TaxID=7240 RepID=B4QI20_DROSI|nr:GD25101 [Drosophila simulans]
MDKDVENQRASHPRIAQDNGRNHSRQRANCTTAAANSVSGSPFSNLPTSGKHNNGFDLTILAAPHPDRNPADELEYFTLDLSWLFCTGGLGQTASATHQCFVAHFIQFCSFDVDDDDDDDGGGGGGSGGDACA